VANTNIGASGLKFRSINAGTAASGPANGIVLNTTGAAGGLTVSGTGSAGTGGTIQKTTGDAVSLTSTNGVNLSWMNIQNSTAGGIKGTTVTGLNLTSCAISANGTTGSNDGIGLTNLLGTSTWTSVDVTNSAHGNVTIINNTGTLTALTVTGGNFNNAVGTFAANGFLLQAQSAAVVSNFTVTGANFKTNKSTGLMIEADNTANITASVQSSTFNDNNAGMDFDQFQSGNLTFKAQNNTVTNPTRTAASGANSTSTAINVFSSSASTGGTLSGRITGNTIGTAATLNSGSSLGNGIRVILQNKTTGSFVIDSNVIRQVPTQFGITVTGMSANAGVGTDATITNNDVVTGDTTGFPSPAIFVSADDLGSSGTFMRADIRGNSVPAGTATGGFLGKYIEEYQSVPSAVCQLIDTPPASANNTAQLTSTNTGSAGASAACTLIAGPINTPP
jgi:hypothetical protein